MKVSKFLIASVFAVSSTAFASETVPTKVTDTKAAPAAAAGKDAGNTGTTLKSTTTTAATYTKEQIVEVQKTLKVTQTGSFDSATTAAIKKFQTEKKLTNTTGTLDADTTAALGLKF